MAPRRQYWLLKSEPSVFSFADLWAAPGRTTSWEGVRNYQARNYLRAMRAGDLAFFYHSSADPTGIAGIAEVVRAAQPDPTQFERGHEGFDPRASETAPTWVAVEIRAVEALPRIVSLDELRKHPALAAMGICQRGSRLSVQPVQASEWGVVKALARRKLQA